MIFAGKEPWSIGPVQQLKVTRLLESDLEIIITMATALTSTLKLPPTTTESLPSSRTTLKLCSTWLTCMN